MESQEPDHCISEIDDECNDLYLSQRMHESPTRNKQGSMSEKTPFKIKLNQIEQEEQNQIEPRKKKSSSISEKTARIAFQPKGMHYNANYKQLNLQFNLSGEKQSDQGANSCNQQRISYNNISEKSANALDQKSNSSIGSQNILSQNGGKSVSSFQIQEQIDENQEIKVEFQKEAAVQSGSSSGNNSPKCSEDSDMYQPFSHFFVLGCDKNDIQEYDKMKADRVLLPGKLLYSYSDRITNTKNDPFELVKKQVSEYVFPFGLEARKVDVPDGNKVPIQQIIIPPTKTGLFDRFFFFKMRSQENFKQVQVEKQKNELLKLVNPNKVLFFTCLQVRDYFGIDDETDKNNKKKNYWRFTKVFCFVSYFPLYDLLTRFLQQIQDQIKVERQFKLMQDDDGSVLNKIDSDYVQEFINTRLTQYLQQWQRTELRTFGQDYQFTLDQQYFIHNLPEHHSFRQKCLSWSLIGPLSVLSFSHFLFILFAILQEQHVIFVSQSLCILTKAIACFEALIMPFQWPYPIVYTLPENLMGLFGSPQPIILGVNRSGRYIMAEKLVQNNPDHIFVLLDEGSILTNNDAYIKQYQKYSPNLSLRSTLPNLYQKVGLSIKDTLQVYNGSQYLQVYQSEKYRKSFPVPKFHCDDTKTLESIMQICHDTFQQRIVSNLPRQIIYDQGGQFLDYEKIQQNILEHTNEEDKNFIKSFCSSSSQIFLYFCEDFYNLIDDGENNNQQY